MLPRSFKRQRENVPDASRPSSKRRCDTITEHSWASGLGLFPKRISKPSLMLPMMSSTLITAQFGKTCTLLWLICLYCKHNIESFVILFPEIKTYK